MKTLKVTIMLDVEDDYIDEIKKLTHHADYLLDLDEYPEIISVHDVTVEEQG